MQPSRSDIYNTIDEKWRVVDGGGGWRVSDKYLKIVV